MARGKTTKPHRRPQATADKSNFCQCEDNRYHLTAQSLAGRLAGFMERAQDPSDIHCCLSGLRVLVVTLRECPQSAETARYYPTKPFTLALRLLGDLTAVSVPRVRRALEEEQAQCDDTHPAAAKASSDVFETFVDLLCQFVVVGLVDGNNPPDVYGMFHKDVLWPKSFEDLFPGGVARTADAFVFWCCVEAGAMPWAVLALTLNLARNVLLPRLMTAENRDRLCWAMLQALSRTPVSWRGTTPPLHPPAGFRPQTSVRGTREIVDGVCGLLGIVGTNGPSGASDLARLVAGYETEFLEAIDKIKGVLATFSRTRQEFMRAFVARLAAPAATPVEASTARLVYLYSKQVARKGQPGVCANASCGGPAGQKLFVCKSCTFVWYCGRLCQKQDWSRNAVPHKLACASLARLRACIPSTGTYDWAIFQPAWEMAALDPADVDNLRNWVLATGTVSAEAL